MEELYLKNHVEFLKFKKAQIKALNEEIEKRRKKFNEKIEQEKHEFEESLDIYYKDLKKVTDEFDSIKDNKISMKLCDMLQELSNLTGIDVFDMGVDIKTDLGYWGKRNKKELIDMMKSVDQGLSCTDNYTNNKTWNLVIYSYKNMDSHDNRQKFCYDFRFGLDLNEIQFDGESLLSHCSTKVDWIETKGRYSTKLVINKNLGNLKCNICLNDLVKDDKKAEYSWCIDRFYPVDLIKTAVINHINPNESTLKDNKKKYISK